MHDRRTRLALIGALVAAAIVVLVVLASGSQEEAPSAQVLPVEGERPNVVLVLTDDQIYDSLAAMARTDARGDWIRFPNAFLHHPLCCPSRVTILTGQYSDHHGILDNGGGDTKEFADDSTLATWLQDAGYETTYVGKYLNGFPYGGSPTTVPPGWDRWIGYTKSQGPYYDYAVNEDGTVVERGSGPADYATDYFAGQTGQAIADTRQPFFLHLALFAPHAPYEPAPRHKGARVDPPRRPSFDERDVSDKPEWVRELPRVDRDEVLAERRDHERTLLAVDDAVEGLFDALRERGVLDRTVVIFMTDNGYAFGEHRYVGKNCAYEECLRTPLLVRLPGGERGGEQIPALVSNVDIAPTIAALAGVEPATPVDGESIVGLFEGDAERVRDAVLIRRAMGPKKKRFWGVRTARFKYVEYANDDRELYDLAEDPHELRNLLFEPTPAAEARAEELAARLERLKEAEPR